MNYAEVYSKLTFETATLIFMKRDGSIRIMLGTRNLSTVSIEHGFKGMELGGLDNRSNIGNGNIALIDLMIGEARSFNMDRLLWIGFNGVIDSMEKLQSVSSGYLEFKEGYEKTKPSEITMEMLDDEPKEHKTV